MKKMSSLLSIKDRQKYMKKLGLYTKGIDGDEGKGTKKGYEYINIIFLNVSSNKYTAKTDEKLRIAYNSYCKSEFKCTCNGKYCDGYNSRKEKCYMKLIMFAQYIRNYFDKGVHISSGVRCIKRNAQVGGVKNSKHLVFKAMDFKVDGKSGKDVLKVAKKMILIKYAYKITTNYIHANI